jgi:L-ascorbate metabolism protein UlaG (beta-lactamase superfamily)
MLSSIAAILASILGAWSGQEMTPAPEVFAPGVVSTGEVYRGTFTADGATFYFFKKIGAGETYRIFSSDRTAAGWTTPRVVDLGGDHSDLYPALSRDGRRLVFSSYRPVPGYAGKPNAHIWAAERTAQGWSAPAPLDRVNTTGHYHSWIEIGYDDALYFRRTTPDWKTNVTMRSARTERGFADPLPYADVERWKAWRPDVRIAGGAPGPGGRLVFLDVATTNPRTGRGASDIWVSVRRDDGWSDPAPLGGGVNSDGYDVFPFVSPDGRDLYFVRDFTAFHRVALADALPARPTGVQARYVANSGMLVTVAGRRFLIDAPIREGIAPYATSSADERARLEGALPPYADVDAILITHWHEDHFSADALAAHLARNPRALLVSSPEVVDRVHAVLPDLPLSRVRAVLPDPGRSAVVDVGGMPVQVLRLRHNRTRAGRFPEQHVGFLIGAAAPVLHVGDADPAADNFVLLKSLPAIDLAFLPFWYLGDDANRRLVAEAIRPRRIVAMHVPPGDVEKASRAVGSADGRAVTAGTPGAALTLPD